ncbi:MAG: V-type ATP synthase subunit I [Oscillospiraceae bacterium]|jgi:V/A-type H+-transporting ATPase subunit I|nr:V-type ATP synthase subunit I [Oscillospiraceae bacterium]
MSIVRMKRFELLAMENDRQVLLAGLQRAGCVHVDEPENAPDWAEIALLAGRAENALDETREKLLTIGDALDILSKHNAIKRPFLAPKRALRQKELLDPTGVELALRDAREIISQSRRISALAAEEGKLEALVAGLEPWESVDVPLDAPQTAHLRILFGYAAPDVSWETLVSRAETDAPLAQLYPAGANREGVYFLALCHSAQEEGLLELLKEYRYTRLQMREFTGTAKANIDRLSEQKRKNAAEREEIAELLRASGDKQQPLELAFDHLSTAAGREETAGRLMATQRTFTLAGWVPESAAGYLDRALSAFDCAVSYESPGEEDDVPVLLRNSSIIEPINMVTEMYSLPKYTNIDPNPIMAPFMAAFFGMMYADMGYGAVLILLGSLVLKKKKPQGRQAYIWKLLRLGGIFSVIFGFIFGSFFGDLIPSFAKGFLGVENLFEKLFGGRYPFIDPLQGAMTVIIMSLVFGVIHLLFGMGVKAYLLIRDGKPLDALMDVGSWWLTFGGIAALALGATPWIMVAGLVSIVLTQGRHNPKLGGKLVSGLGKLYDITAYLSDVLSYLRLMALALASGVIANVFNILATMGGKSVGGILLFIVIVPVGHAFNMAINIIGTYVHAARLQFLEFFGKFFDDGGRPFAPLSIKTKYVDILKEDN